MRIKTMENNKGNENIFQHAMLLFIYHHEVTILQVRVAFHVPYMYSLLCVYVSSSIHVSPPHQQQHTVHSAEQAN